MCVVLNRVGALPIQKRLKIVSPVESNPAHFLKVYQVVELLLNLERDTLSILIPITGSK